MDKVLPRRGTSLLFIHCYAYGIIMFMFAGDLISLFCITI